LVAAPPPPSFVEGAGKLRLSFFTAAEELLDSYVDFLVARRRPADGLPPNRQKRGSVDSHQRRPRKSHFCAATTAVAETNAAGRAGPAGTA